MENHNGSHLNKTRFEIGLGYFNQVSWYWQSLKIRLPGLYAGAPTYSTVRVCNFVQWVILSATPCFTQRVLVCSILDFAHTVSCAKLGTKLTFALHTA